MKKIIRLIIAIIIFSIAIPVNAYFMTTSSFSNNININNNGISCLIDFKTNSEDLDYQGNDHIRDNNIYLPIINKEGYDFIGYKNVLNNTIYNGGDYINLTSNIKRLEAIYNIQNYNITYDLNGGTAYNLIDSYNIEDDDIILPKPEKTGYTFYNWHEQNNKYSDSKDIVINKGSCKGDLFFQANFYDNISPVIKSVNIKTLRNCNSNECYGKTWNFMIRITVNMIEQGEGFKKFLVNLSSVGSATGTGFEVPSGEYRPNIIQNEDGTITVIVDDDNWSGGNRSVTITAEDKNGNQSSVGGYFQIGSGADVTIEF